MRSLSINGRINETYQIQLEIKGLFNLKKTFTFATRLCEAGEYYDKNLLTCLTCPDNSYSLEAPSVISSTFLQQEDISICKTCPTNNLQRKRNYPGL